MIINCLPLEREHWLLKWNHNFYSNGQHKDLSITISSQISQNSGKKHSNCLHETRRHGCPTAHEGGQGTVEESSEKLAFFGVPPALCF